MSLPDSETAECYIVWVPYCQSLNVKLSILHKNKISQRFMHLLAASRYCYEISLFIIWSSNKSHLNINACALVLQQRQIIQRAISLLCASLLTIYSSVFEWKTSIRSFQEEEWPPSGDPVLEHCRELSLYRWQSILKTFVKGNRLATLPKPLHNAVANIRNRLLWTPPVDNALLCHGHLVEKWNGTWWAGAVTWSSIKYLAIFMKTGFSYIPERNVWQNGNI